MVNVDHEPDSAWDCRGCGKDWPCDEVRDELWVKHRRNPARLAIHMCKLLEQAAPALVAAGLHPDEMFDRFIAWTRRQELDATLPSAREGVPGC